ncbi:MAG TPA: hypothetical protein VIG93_06435 [Gaiellaceae bacterium]
MRALVLLAALCAVLAAGCGSGSDGAAAPTPSAAEATPLPAASSRAAAPAIAGTTLEGDRVSLADFRGRPVFVNVWSSW